MNIAYFKGNILYDVSPRKHPDSLYEDRDIAYNADVLVIDGEKYDMSVKDDVEKIPVLPSEPTWDGVFELSYILKIRCGVEKDPRLIPAFVNKVLATYTIILHVVGLSRLSASDPQLLQIWVISRGRFI